MLIPIISISFIITFERKVDENNACDITLLGGKDRPSQSDGQPARRPQPASQQPPVDDDAPF